ncbi:MAG: C40 family peptidase, partial [Frankia sp.]
PASVTATPAPTAVTAIPAPTAAAPPRTTTTAARTTATSLATVTTAHSASSLGSQLVALAASHAGAPYVYGGSGPSSFDCSGLVQYIYHQLGRSIPRTAQAQYDFSTKIPQANAQPGDLIFFGGTSSIYHVGIYAGGGMMWAAPHTGTVVQLEKIWTTDYHVGRIS